MISGTCFCNAVKYELSAESQMQGLCYCTDCQVVRQRALDLLCGGASGLPPLAGSMTAYTYDSGSGREVTRHFCDTCGTQIMVQLMPWAWRRSMQ